MATLIHQRHDPCDASSDGFHRPVWVQFQHGRELLCDFCALPLNEEVWT